MANPEQKIRICTDTGSSITKEDPLITEKGVLLLPLNIIFTIDGKKVEYDDYDLKAGRFYQMMRNSKELPTTSGAILGKAYELYKKLTENNEKIVSIHLTSVHSAAFESAFKAKDTLKEEGAKLSIEVMDSKQISIGQRFLVEEAALLAETGASMEEIIEMVLVNREKINLLVALSTLENLRKGGRVNLAQFAVGSILRMKPILGLDNGKLEPVAKIRTNYAARREIVERVKSTKYDIVKMGILHTNDLEGAQEVKEMISEFYKGDIQIIEAGPVLGVHAGSGAVGVVFQEA